MSYSRLNIVAHYLQVITHLFSFNIRCENLLFLPKIWKLLSTPSLPVDWTIVIPLSLASVKKSLSTAHPKLSRQDFNWEQRNMITFCRSWLTLAIVHRLLIKPHPKLYFGPLIALCSFPLPEILRFVFSQCSKVQT